MRRLACLAVTGVHNTFTVTSLADSGSGSLRQAILDANNSPGLDAIHFAVAGTIRAAATTRPRARSRGRRGAT